ncbi:MAG: hypothetical protein H0V05_08820, partial [Euzebyaceae bacterium]|nr:hypothetical protein [Euzebyaceae bacterium]
MNAGPRRYAPARGRSSARVAVNLARLLLELSLLLATAVLLGLLARRVRIPVTVVLTVVGFAAAALGGTLVVGERLQGEGFEEVL